MQSDNKEMTNTHDNGSTVVQVAAVGEVIGSDLHGAPVAQSLTENALQKIADTQDDILVDVDHESEKNGKTAAAGWLKALKLIPGVGLFGRIDWTDIGRKLVDNRVFRWLSPSFIIDEETREPLCMTSLALTNKPAQAGMIAPIINQAPAEEQLETEEKLKMEMTREELIALIKEVIASEPAAEQPAAEEEAEVTANETPAAEEEAEVTANETPAEEVQETKEETKEVIPLAALNSKPATPTLAPAAEKWRNMTQAEFTRWVDAGMPK